MPVVTRITQQKRRTDRYSIYIDNAYRLSLSATALQVAGLRTGDELSEPAIAQLETASELGKALDYAYRYLTLRLRSRDEVVTYLRRKQYEDELIEQALTELERQGAVNDYRFAMAWVEDRQLLSPRSRHLLQAELRQKGIETSIIDEVLGTIGDDDEVATLKSLISTKRLLFRYDDQRKLIQYLTGKGFSYGTIKAALEQLEEVS